MKARKIAENVYWVGAVDWSVRNFHGYSTNKGSSYGAYLIVDEKIALIDTVKAPFTGEMLERIRSVVDPEKIDIIISNHVEQDHSGSIPEMKKICPNATIYTSGPSGVKGLTFHYGEYDYVPVKSNDVISLGKLSLTFVATPMLHWPDNMVTYCPELKILFSNDAFGQHYASSSALDTQVDMSELMYEAKKYYANIIMCYGKQAHNVVKQVQGMDIDIIAPSHGIVWTKHIPDIIDAYLKWSSNEPEDKALVVFDSMWHATEKMARAIAESFAEQGIPVRYYDLKETHISDIIVDVLDCKYIAVGSPTLNGQMLPTVASFLCYMKGLSPKDRQAFAFGAHGWSNMSVPKIEEELTACGFQVCTPGMKVQYVPTSQQLEEIRTQVAELVQG